MGRKNKRKRSAYEKGLGFNPNKYISKHNTHITALGATPDSSYDSLYDEVMEEAERSENYLKRRKLAASAANPNGSGFTEFQPKNPQRRDIWYAELGPCADDYVQNGCRPVFVISSDKNNKHANVITVVPMTSKYKHPHLPGHVWLEGQYCERGGKPVNAGPSMLLGEQITTIDKKSLRGYVGRVQDRSIIERIEKAVRAHLGMPTGFDLRGSDCYYGNPAPENQNTSEPDQSKNTYNGTEAGASASGTTEAGATYMRERESE